MPFCMGDTIHSISASILFHGTKMIQVRVLSLERSVHLQPIETSNSKRHPDHWWPLMTTDDHWWPLGRWQLWSSPLLHHWFKEVQCQMPSCYLFTGADHGTEANEIASNSQICHQLSGIAGWPWHLLCFLWITGYCRILQDYWASSLLYWYYSYPTHLAFLKCARGDRHETIWSTWRELVSRDPWGLCLQAKHLHGL